MKDDIVIVSATRTPVGAFNGALASLPAHELGKVGWRRRSSAPASKDARSPS